LNNINYEADLSDQFIELNQDEKIILANVTVENISESEKYPVNQFSLRDDLGNIYLEPELGYFSDDLLPSSLQPGEKATGSLPFRVNKTANKANLYFTTNSLDEVKIFVFGQE